jgi:hypothetical protein
MLVPGGQDAGRNLRAKRLNLTDTIKLDAFARQHHASLLRRRVNRSVPNVHEPTYKLRIREKSGVPKYQWVHACRPSVVISTTIQPKPAAVPSLTNTATHILIHTESAPMWHLANCVEASKRLCCKALMATVPNHPKSDRCCRRMPLLAKAGKKLEGQGADENLTHCRAASSMPYHDPSMAQPCKDECSRPVCAQSHRQCFWESPSTSKSKNR